MKWKSRTYTAAPCCYGGHSRPRVQPGCMANREVGKRVAEHRNRLRDQGLRPLPIWVPDTRAPEFAAEARRQSILAAACAAAGDEQAFVDAVSQFTKEAFYAQ